MLDPSAGSLGSTGVPAPRPVPQGSVQYPHAWLPDARPSGLRRATLAAQSCRLPYTREVAEEPDKGTRDEPGSLACLQHLHPGFRGERLKQHCLWTHPRGTTACSEAPQVTAISSWQRPSAKRQFPALIHC